MVRNECPGEPQNRGVAGSSFLDEHAFRPPLADTFHATFAQGESRPPGRLAPVE